MKKPCIDCGTPSDSTRCPTHTRAKDKARGTRKQRGLGADHDRIRAQVLEEEKVCWLDGLPGTEDDPLTADHVVPRSHGGRNVRSNYRAAHRSCNSSRQDDLARNLRSTFQGGAA